jgi:hypothetical protein
VTPTVWLVVDGSGSMGERFADSSRWETLRSALMAPDGVVATLQNAVRFGLVIYNGPQETGGGRGGGGGGGDDDECFAPQNINALCRCFTGLEPSCCEPQCGAAPAPMTPATDPMAPTTPPAMPPAEECATVMVVNPALSNYAAIDTAYPQTEVGGSTPTHRALEHIVTTLPVVNKQLPDSKEGPIYVILATDGAPNDACTGAGGGGRVSFDPATAMRVVEVVTQGVQAGMRMFVVSLAGDDNELRQHLQEVAAIGSPGQMPFEPATKDELVNTLQQLVSGATCQVALEGRVTVGQECSGEVTLNGERLTCNVADGWRLIDDHTVALTGAACESFLLKQSMVNATFPCGVFIPK